MKTSSNNFDSKSNIVFLVADSYQIKIPFYLIVEFDFNTLHLFSLAKSPKNYYKVGYVREFRNHSSEVLSQFHYNEDINFLERKPIVSHNVKITTFQCDYDPLSFR